MKKVALVLILALFTTISWAQLPKVKAVGYKSLTTTERDALTVPAGEHWKIYNSTTDQYEYWNGSAWLAFTGTEIDPLYVAWDKSTGIEITESQISDLGDYETTSARVYTTNATYTTDSIHSGMEVKMTGGASIVLDDAKVRVNDHFYVANLSGSSIPFSFGAGDSAYQGTLPDLGDGLYAYCRLDAANSWSVIVGSASGGGGSIGGSASDGLISFGSPTVNNIQNDPDFRYDGTRFTYPGTSRNSSSGWFVFENNLGDRIFRITSATNAFANNSPSSFFESGKASAIFSSDNGVKMTQTGFYTNGFVIDGTVTSYTNIPAPTHLLDVNGSADFEGAIYTHGLTSEGDVNIMHSTGNNGGFGGVINIGGGNGFTSSITSSASELIMSPTNSSTQYRLQDGGALTGEGVLRLMDADGRYMLLSAPALSANLDIGNYYLTDNAAEESKMRMNGQGLDLEIETHAAFGGGVDKWRFSTASTSVNDRRGYLIFTPSHAASSTSLEFVNDDTGESGIKMFTGKDFFDFNGATVQDAYLDVRQDPSTSNNTISTNHMGEVIVTTSATAKTWTIPDTLDEKAGATFTIMVKGTGPVTVETSGTAMINGSTTFEIVIEGKTNDKISAVQFIQDVASSDDWSALGKY